MRGAGCDTMGLTATPTCGGLVVGLLLVAQSVAAAMAAAQQPAVHFEPPVALRGGPGQPQATSTNTMGLFHLGGDNALFQEFTVDYYPYQNRTTLLFSSDGGRHWARPAGGDAYDSISCMNVAHPGKGCAQGETVPGCECTWMVNPTISAPVQGHRGVRGYRIPMDAHNGSSGGLVDYNTSSTSEFTATPSGQFMLKQTTGLPLRFIGLPRAWDGSVVQLNPEAACNSIVLPDGSHLMCALVGSAGCWGASTSASCMALNRTGLSDNGCTSELACPGPTLVALQSMDAVGQLWRYKGVIYQGRSIFVETNLAVLSDSKTLIAVIRISGNGGCGTIDNPTDPVGEWHTSTDYRWYHQSYSTDMGATWTKPTPIVGAGSCRPRLVAFPGGPLVLAGGRMCVAGMQGLFLWVSWNGMGSWNNGVGHGDGSVDEWVPISISDAHNCGLEINAPDSQRFTEAVNESNGWQTQAELGFIAVGDPARKEALLTYNRYGGSQPGHVGCPGNAPCSSIAFSMRVSFNANSTATRCSKPACSAAQGAKLATEYCQSPIYQGPKREDCPGGSTNQTTATWLALKSGPGTPEWRCYSLSSLNAAHTAYQGPSRDFCSEGAVLETIVRSCKLPPISGPTPAPTPTPSPPPSPGHVLPFHVIPTPSDGDILVRNPASLPAHFAAISRQEPVNGSKAGDYKPVIAQLNNTDLLIAFTTHRPPLYAVFLRSTDVGKSWVRDESQTQIRGNEWALHSLSDGSVLLLDSGNGTAAAVYRSTDWGRSFKLSQMIACKEMGWSVIEENGTWAPRGVYLFADSTIHRSSDMGRSFAPHIPVVTDMGWSDGDTFFGQSTVFRSKGSGILRHVTRVGVDPSWDQTDGSQLWQSLDPTGATWRCTTQAAGGWCGSGHTCAPTQQRQCRNATFAFGTPGTMYSRFLQLSDGRVLNTFTQRCNGVGPHPSAIACGGNGQGDGYGTGLRALVSTDEGASFDFSRDYLILSAQDDNANPFISGKTAQGCMCGYGGSIQLGDGSLLTPYCYTNVSTEMSLIGVVRWRLP